MNFKAILSMLLRVIKSSLFITVLGLLALALLIWFGGPLVAIAGVEPLATTSARLITLLSIALIWMISQFIKRSRELKTHNQAVESLLSSDEQQHDELAKRDIENCAACHDVQGADPNCILCHSDPDGVKGTNPKTHEINFMRDVEGDWHTDVRSICYDCHSSSNTSGVGFCGYCHGVKN